MEKDFEYQEVFERTGFNTAEEAKYKISAVIEAHPSELGWQAGEPEVYKDADGKYGVRIPLKKYPVSTKEGRLR